jgi:hypothetical protein
MMCLPSELSRDVNPGGKALQFRTAGHNPTLESLFAA